MQFLRYRPKLTNSDKLFSALCTGNKSHSHSVKHVLWDFKREANMPLIRPSSVLISPPPSAHTLSHTITYKVKTTITKQELITISSSNGICKLWQVFSRTLWTLFTDGVTKGMSFSIPLYLHNMYNFLTWFFITILILPLCFNEPYPQIYVIVCWNYFSSEAYSSTLSSLGSPSSVRIISHPQTTRGDSTLHELQPRPARPERLAPRPRAQLMFFI